MSSAHLLQVPLPGGEAQLLQGVRGLSNSLGLWELSGRAISILQNKVTYLKSMLVSVFI